MIFWSPPHETLNVQTELKRGDKNDSFDRIPNDPAINLNQISFIYERRYEQYYAQLATYKLLNRFHSRN